jgi:hypothetical protein
MSKNRLAAFVSGSTRMAWMGCALLLVTLSLNTSAMAVDLPAPEIDPGSAGSALTLLVSGVLILRDRIRRK